MAKHLTRKQWNNILHYDEDFDAWDLADALREVDRLQHAQWKLIQETHEPAMVRDSMERSPH
jgi:hypothetical protein